MEENRWDILIAEGEQIRASEKTQSIWQESFDTVLNSLYDIKDLSECNLNEARERFSMMEISRCETFKDFMAMMSPEASRVFNKSGQRMKNIRTSSKAITCDSCGSQMKIEGDDAICLNQKCKIKKPLSEISSGKSISDKTKHLSDKLSIVTGVKKPPRNVMNILSYLEVWLRNLTHLRDYLASKDATQKFLANYEKVLHELTFRSNDENRRLQQRKDLLYVTNPISGKLTLNLDQSEIPQDAKYAFTFPEYDLIVTAFCDMLTECSRLYEDSYVKSHMEAYEIQENIEVMYAFWEKYGRIPVESETFTYNDKVYDIGNYCTYLKLTYGEEYTETIKTLSGIEPIIPGLTFSFIGLAREKGGKTQITPKRYNFTENYGYIIQYVFAIPHITMDEHDKADILELVSLFDTFVAGDSGNQNAPIYTIKLRLIFNLARFNKYRELNRYLPMKSNTSCNDRINKYWAKFISIPPYDQLIRKYNTPVEEVQAPPQQFETNFMETMIAKSIEEVDLL